MAGAGGPNAVAETVRPPATTVGGGRGAAPSADSLFLGLGESIADAKNSLDVVLADLFPDVLDVRVDRALIRLERHASHRIEQLSAGEHPPRLPCHRGQDLELALGQIHALA